MPPKKFRRPTIMKMEKREGKKIKLPPPKKRREIQRQIAAAGLNPDYNYLLRGNVPKPAVLEQPVSNELAVQSTLNERVQKEHEELLGPVEGGIVEEDPNLTY